MTVIGILITMIPIQFLTETPYVGKPRQFIGIVNINCHPFCALFTKMHIIHLVYTIGQYMLVYFFTDFEFPLAMYTCNGRLIVGFKMQYRHRIHSLVTKINAKVHETNINGKKE